jgi:dihydroorotate dehydrogenase
VTRAAHELATTLLGVPLALPLLNAPGTAEHAWELEALVAMGAGAICLRPVTVHPFVHPEFRALRNPGHDRLLPLVRQLAELGQAPVIACVAGSTAEELAFLARVFGEAGAALVQLHLGDAWVAATLAPFQDAETLAHVLETVREQATTPLLCEVPSEARGHYADVARALRETGVGGAVLRGDFMGLEKFVLESGARDLQVVAVADVDSGWAARRLLEKGARAIQLDRALRLEGAKALARIAGEMRAAKR